MIRFRHALPALLLLLSVATWAPAWAAPDLAELDLFDGGEEQVVSTARSPRPISRIAENVSVITADQIALLNAHTLADVLQTVPGFQLLMTRTPGSNSQFMLNGSSNWNVLVLVDGVPQDEVIENNAETSQIPAQRIERVEIIKGAASAAWGHALGGVINVVTKSPDPERKFGGTGFASYGERATSDLQGEFSGTIDRFGYLVSGGNLRSKGLRPGNNVNLYNAFGKFTYDVPGNGRLTLGLDFRDIFRGDEESSQFNFHDTTYQRNLQGYLAFAMALNDRLGMEVRLWGAHRDEDGRLGDLSPPALWKNYLPKQSRHGGDAKLMWDGGWASGVIGLEYKHDEIRQLEPVQLNAPEQIDRTFDRWGAYANGAFSFGDLTLLPGLRADHTGLDSDNLSYTLGATYRLTDKTVARAYGARGYSLPNIAFDTGLQKIWTVQVGAETTEIPYLWLKGTLFYNDTWNIQEISPITLGIVLKEQIKQGFEVEARTVPVFGVSFGGGYTLVDARDKETRDRIPSIPQHSAKLSATYNNVPLGLSGILTGNYVWWRSEGFLNARYSAIIWDLSATQKVMPSRELSPEVFLTAHNLFNGSQYWFELYKNPQRWIEGGVRFRF